MSAEYCIGPCNAIWRRQRNHEVSPRLGDPIWCDRCKALIRARLMDLDDQAALLATIERQPGPGATSPAPHVDDLDELRHTLLSWEDAYRMHCRMPPTPKRGRHAATLIGTIAWLSVHLDGLLDTDGAADFGREVLRLHRRLVRHNDGGRPRGRSALQCPGCDLRSISHISGTDRVKCRNLRCGRSFSLQEYRAYLRAEDE